MNNTEFRAKYGIPHHGGIPSFCTANELVINAILEYAGKRNLPILIEATCNQVNPDGGYTGMRAQDFADWIAHLAKTSGVDSQKLILGGDHLGPNPWTSEPAEIAMSKAEQLVKEYVEAGFTKIHIDTSMACGGEDHPSFELVAERAARLCLVAEKFAPDPQALVYVIGTEVPTPGGELDDVDELSVTTPERFNRTVETHETAFKEAGLESIWERVIAVVTQPGVDFSHTAIHQFQPEKAVALSDAIDRLPNLTFEAHSTDYQPTECLNALTKNKFSILKVGPELTYRMREAVFSLAQIESIVSDQPDSDIISVVDRAMSSNPKYWASYYHGENKQLTQLKHFSYSDRIRYYWAEETVNDALQRLIENLEHSRISETVISQYFPYREFQELKASPRQLISDHINLCVARYYKACGFYNHG